MEKSKFFKSGTLRIAITNSLINLGLVFSGILTPILFFEIYLRRSNNIPIFTTENFVRSQLTLTSFNKAVVHDNTLGWRLKENTFFPVMKMSTGELGVRMNSEDVRPLPKNAILAVGDSFTVGAGVAHDQTWPAYLEEVGGEPVLNAACGAWGVDQIVLRAETMVPETDPKTVIVSLLAQDSFRNNYKKYGGSFKPYFLIENGQAVLKGVPVPPAQEKPVELDRKRAILGHFYIAHWTMIRSGKLTQWVDNEKRYQQYEDSEHVAVQVSCLLMERLARLREEYGVRVIVVMQWVSAEVLAPEAPWYGIDVLKCAQNNGLEILDSRDALKDVSEQNTERFKGFWLDEGGQPGHMSPEGNRFIANLIWEKLFK